MVTPTASIYSRATIRRLIDQYGMHPQKRWGQNFLVDLNSARKIVDALPKTGDGVVWEVGPGFGALTELLYSRAQKLTLFEIDHALIRYLTQRWSGGVQVIDTNPTEGAGRGDARLCLVAGDALKTLPRALAQNDCIDALIGNLPYRNAARLLICCARSVSPPRTVIVTVQQEVAERIMATNGRDYSSFSVMMQLVYEVRGYWRVPRTVFYPTPNVESTCLQLSRRTTRNEREEAVTVTMVEPLVRAAFQSRRATLHKNILRSPRYCDAYRRLQHNTAHAAWLAQICRARAEQLTPTEFVKLAEVLGE